MIYLLEDDDNIRNFVVYALCQTEMKAKGFETSETFWRAMETEIPELVLLDIMLPKEDGCPCSGGCARTRGLHRCPSSC